MIDPPIKKIHSQVKQLYHDLDQEIATINPVCEISGRCCRFKEYGHRLYFSRPEAEILLQDGLPKDAVVTEENCPFQINNLCTAREKRPLGCRVYFCDESYQSRCTELSEQYINQLKILHEENSIPWEYKPLHQWCNEESNS